MKRKASITSITLKHKHHANSIDLSGTDLSESSSSDDYFPRFFRQEKHSHAPNDSLADIENLDVSRCRLGPGGTSNLLSYLSRSSSRLVNLKQLSLQRNAMGSEGGRCIGNFLATQKIELLDISLNDIKAGGGEPTAAKVISDSLLNNAKLNVLVMDKCALGPEGATHIAHALKFNKSMRRLELAGNMIGPAGGKEIFNALTTYSSLRELGLKMNRIGGCSDKFDVQALSDSLSGGCGLTKLDLSYNDLRCEGCAILSQALLSDKCMIQELTLEKNDVGSEGVVALANALCINQSLERLDLKGNKVCNGGAAAIGNMLANNSTLKTIDLSSCSIGNEGGSSIGRGLGTNDSLEYLMLDKNLLGDGMNIDLFSEGLSMNNVLKKVQLRGNGFADSDEELWNDAVAKALANNTTLCYIDLSNNAFSDQSIIKTVATPHSSMEYFDISDNNFEYISIETQLLLSKRIATMQIDMSLNPLSSPPLGRLATHSNLQSYLNLLASEKTAVTRIRLMVLGYGGVGKSTFCRAHTTDLDEAGRNNFQSSLVPVHEWDMDRLVDWAMQLGTSWSIDVANLISDEQISGKNLIEFIIDAPSADCMARSSQSLLDLCASKYPRIDCETLARSIHALYQKGYLSTVGAVKVDGTIELGNRTCSLVDFAGQVEFLVSHQLLLSSMHTLCMIIQPAPSFGKPDHRHYGSWDYWSRFLSSLGDRRRGSLLLAVSQLDKVVDSYCHNSADYSVKEFARIKSGASGAISSSGPLMLDYSPSNIMGTVAGVKAALSQSLDEVASSWWVPLSYERLATILQDVIKRKTANHELPKLTRSELLEEIDTFCAKSTEDTMLLSKMKSDNKLLQRAIDYLEAVGDIMQAGDFLLLDPIGWFSGFLAHFIKDELAVSTVQVDATTLRRQRGTVSLDEIVVALGHDYKSPHEHVSQIMSLLCGLELCVPLKGDVQDAKSTPDTPTYLFPCLLPPLATPSELSAFDKTITPAAIRGHRFHEVSGFIPPGLFVGLLARMYQKLKNGVMHHLRVWKDHALLIFNNNATGVLLKLNLENATIDVVGWASENEQLFVGAAKGQASVVTWIVHLIKIFLRSYSQPKFKEFWLCPSPKCHGIDRDDCSQVPYHYAGSEFLLCFNKHAWHVSHDCDVEGCWRFLGSGHSLERMKLHQDAVVTCKSCNSEPIFTLREMLT